ncbi:hypothetical protein BD560DRAFT_429415 [Blakeslea trispora]|nr:hypothetical protein BD560DRAFT_429415 [Blakeslea trispora]
MKTDIVLITLLNEYFMMKPNGSVKQTKFTSDLLEINPMNDEMKLRGKVISKSWQFYSKNDTIIVNIFAGEEINSSYISAALWIIKRSLKSIMFFERHIMMDQSEKQILVYTTAQAGGLMAQNLGPYSPIDLLTN